MSLLRSEKGFSLVEAMIAVAILGLGMAGVGTLLHNAYSQSTRALSDRNMFQVASDIAEDIKSQLASTTNWADVEAINLNNPKPPANPIYLVDYTSSGQAGGHNFTERWGRTRRFVFRWVVSDGHVSGALRLGVTVAWDDNMSTESPITQSPDSPNYWKHKSRTTSYVFWAKK